MKEFKHVINDPMGMHARPAGMLVKAVAGYTSKITITAPTGTADARRLMALMKLAAKAGMELTITVEGADEEKAAAELQGQGYGKLKERVTDCVIATLEPLQTEHKRLMADKAYLQGILDENAQRANAIALRTLRKVQKKVGFAARV